MAVSPTAVNTKLRRYRLAQNEPCVLERDGNVAEIPVLGEIAVDDAGNVFVASTVEVARVHPGAKVICTKDPALDLTGWSEEAITLSRDGKVGYIGYLKRSGGTQIDRRIVKLTADATSCAITPLAISGVTLGGIDGLALDGKGRLHVADDDVGGAAPRVVVVDASGAFQFAYDQVTGDKLVSISNLSACKSGICGLDLGEAIVFSENGTFVGRGDVTYVEGMRFPKLRGGPKGPLFVVGTRYVDPPRPDVYILRAR
jgi:hypothetical protein